MCAGEIEVCRPGKLKHTLMSNCAADQVVPQRLGPDRPFHNSKASRSGDWSI